MSKSFPNSENLDEAFKQYLSIDCATFRKKAAIFTEPHAVENVGLIKNLTWMSLLSVFTVERVQNIFIKLLPHYSTRDI